MARGTFPRFSFSSENLNGTRLEKILDEISVVKLSYALYGLLKTVVYGALLFFSLELVGKL